jgi:hypothetical protein
MAAQQPVAELLQEGNVGLVEDLLNALQAVDENQRKQAESALEQLQQHPDRLVTQLSNALVRASTAHTRQMASIVLRRQVIA